MDLYEGIMLGIDQAKEQMEAKVLLFKRPQPLTPPYELYPLPPIYWLAFQNSQPKSTKD